MAIFHLTIKLVKRAEGRSATAAAAYRSGSRIFDQASGKAFDYSNRHGVEGTEIVLPDSREGESNEWARNREVLWNAAELIEKRKDSRVAREYEVGLPHELTNEQRFALTRAYSQELANRFGVAVDFAIHRPHKAGDERNVHAHILTTTRKVEAQGLGIKADPELSETKRAKNGLVPGPDEFVQLRDRWESLCNEALLTHGHEIRIDRRTLKDQGIEREPTTHVGPVVMERIRRGKDSKVMDRINEERQAAARETLERAIEAKRLERESRALESQILDLSSDLRRALLDRDRQRESKAAEPTMKAIDERQRQSAERWLEYRQGRVDKIRNEPTLERGLILSTEAPTDAAAKREKVIILDRDGAGLEP